MLFFIVIDRGGGVAVMALAVLAASLVSLPFMPLFYCAQNEKLKHFGGRAYGFLGLVTMGTGLVLIPVSLLGVVVARSKTQPVSDNRQWRSATYRDLEVGKSTRRDMLRVLGEPKASVEPQARITTNPNPIIAYHYGGTKGYGGNLVVGVEKATHMIAWIETSPENLSHDDVIKQFGGNYVLTGYKPDDCFMDGQPQMLRETSVEAISPVSKQMEYRQIGTVVQLRPSQEVYRIIYISDKWPYGNTSSLCNQPKKRLAYIACGCGCCGGVETKRQCIYQSKGDGLQQIVQRDKDAKNPGCALVGCSFGTKYVYCD